jgi:glucose-1-phosphate thymidylyltransferase
MKGIILAGGSGTRLYPATRSVCKQLLPVYDKPLIYYPLSTLMLAGITEIMIISTPQDVPRFEQLFGNGSDWGIQLEYMVQEAPNGLAEAFILGKDFIGNDSVCLILGDNFFFGHDLAKAVMEAAAIQNGARVFGYYVNNPESYGVVEFDSDLKVVHIEEKPKAPKSNYAVVGIYFYDNTVVKKALNLKPSSRGELEITDLNNLYLEDKQLDVRLLGRGFAWLDTGTHDSLLDAGNFVKAIEDRQGLKIACIEEIAFTQGFIDRQKMLDHIEKNKKTGYGSYLASVLERPYAF